MLKLSDIALKIIEYLTSLLVQTQIATRLSSNTTEQTIEAT